MVSRSESLASNLCHMGLEPVRACAYGTAVGTQSGSQLGTQKHALPCTSHHGRHTFFPLFFLYLDPHPLQSISFVKLSKFCREISDEQDAWLFDMIKDAKKYKKSGGGLHQATAMCTNPGHL